MGLHTCYRQPPVGTSLDLSTPTDIVFGAACYTGQAVPATYEASAYYTQDVGGACGITAAMPAGSTALTVTASMDIAVGDIVSFGTEGPYSTPDAIALAEKGQK